MWDIVQQDIISNGGVMVSMLASSGVDRGFEWTILHNFYKNK
jgi:hypothetical protein